MNPSGLTSDAIILTTLLCGILVLKESGSHKEEFSRVPVVAKEQSGDFKYVFLVHSGILTGFFVIEQIKSGPSRWNQGWGLGFPLYPRRSPDTSL